MTWAAAVKTQTKTRQRKSWKDRWIDGDRALTPMAKSTEKP
jgi:hypothetical protein